MGGERPARISGSGRSACTTRAGSGAPSASRVLPVVTEPKALAVTRLCPPDALADMKYSIYIFLLKKKKSIILRYLAQMLVICGAWGLKCRVGALVCAGTSSCESLNTSGEAGASPLPELTWS